MFDYFKFTAPAHHAQHLLKSEILGFCIVVNKDGEITTTKQGYERHRAKFMEFDIVVWLHPFKPSRIEINGSFHKAAGKGVNWWNFTFADFRNMVHLFCNKIEIPPKDLFIHGLEHGVNVQPCIETAQLIEGIKCLSGKKYERDTINNTGLFLQFPFAQFTVKIYDKYLQYANQKDGPKEPVIRVELKVTRMDYLKQKGVNITTLQDLLSGEWNHWFAHQLLKQWESLVICPEGMVNPEMISNRRTRDNFRNGLNADYWTNLNSRTYNKQSIRFRDIVRQYSIKDVQGITAAQIAAQCEHLHLGKLSERVKYYSYVNGNINPNPIERYYCKGCGQDITYQTTSNEFCTGKYKGERAAHNCRNTYWNRVYSDRKRYPGPTLFPVQVHW